MSEIMGREHQICLGISEPESPEQHGSTYKGCPVGSGEHRKSLAKFEIWDGEAKPLQ